jgi:hypothetical protein
MILEYMSMLTLPLPLHHFKILPHPTDTYVLPHMAVPLHYLQHKGREYSTFSKHFGNSSMSYKSKDGITEVGFITSMWTQVIMGKLYSFIIVSLHRPLSVEDEQKSPFVSRPGFLSAVFYSQPSESCKQVVVEAEQIIGHVACYIRPPGTFGIEAGTMSLANSLHHHQ